MKYATFDLGTGAFGYLLAEKQPDQSFRIIGRNSRFVKFGEGRIGHITEGAFERGLTCLTDFMQELKTYGDIEGIACVGTEALRMADNGVHFITEVRDRLGLHVEVIDGIEEARLNYVATRSTLPHMPENSLIMDIGGGSVEYVIGNKREMLWSGSYKTGMMVLRRHFYRNDPLHHTDVADLRKFLSEHYAPMQIALGEHGAAVLVGNQGSFDTILALLGRYEKGVVASFTKDEFLGVLDMVLPTTVEERQKILAITPERKGHLPITLSMIAYVIEMAGVEEVIVSPSGVRHGLLYDRFG